MNNYRSKFIKTLIHLATALNTVGGAAELILTEETNVLEFIEICARNGLKLTCEVIEKED